ncbi:hypothetical protein [Methylobacterium sp. D48H]
MEWLIKSLLFVFGAFGVVMTGILKDEIIAWLPRTTTRIIDIAINRAPIELREQYQQEWPAHVAEYPGNISPFFQALRILAGAGTGKSWTWDRAVKYLAAWALSVQIFGGGFVVVFDVTHFSSNEFGNYSLIEWVMVCVMHVLPCCAIVHSWRKLQSRIALQASLSPEDEIPIREVPGLLKEAFVWELSKITSRWRR